MRIDVVKFLIFGPWSRRDAFFADAQVDHIAEFISKKPEQLERPQDIKTFLEARHILRARVPVKQAAPYDWHSAIVFARHIVERKEKLEQMKERRRILEKDLSRIVVFGDFSLSELHATEAESNRHIQFFYAKKIENLESLANPNLIYAGTAHGLYYFISVSKQKASYEGLVEMKIERSLGDIRSEMALLDRRIDAFEDELAQLAHHQKELKQGLADALNRYHLEQSKERVDAPLEGELFAVEAWIPKNKIPVLNKISQKNDVHAEQVEIGEKERVPTYLENKAFGSLGQDLVSIYDTPSRGDRDPSWWVFFSFALFFSMILADLGYGLLLLGLSIYLMWKFRSKTGLGKRIIKLTFYLSIGCIFWGIMLPSFFGIELPPDSKWRKASLVTWMIEKKADYLMKHKGKTYNELVKEYPQVGSAKTPLQFLTNVSKTQDKKTTYPVFDAFQDNILIELAIFIGTIHIMISFLRYVDRNWPAIGWVIFMIGGYLYFPSIIKATSLIHYVFGIPEAAGAHVGFILIWVGLGLAALLALIQKRLGGLGEVMQVIQVFADVMSYLRIYALSLAGMIMASTFNHIASKAPIYLGILIILAGHSINLVLAIMGGIIHGLRLNFIEWYHYSFEGGGKLFNPLSLFKIE